MKPQVAVSSPIADRIRAYVRDRQREDPKYSARRLSTEAGFSPTHLSMTLKRLDIGSHVSHDILAAIARAMGMPLSALLGEDTAPPLMPLLEELPGWQAAVAEAAARYTVRPEAIAALAKWRPSSIPRHLDGAVIASLVRAWEEMQGK